VNLSQLREIQADYQKVFGGEEGQRVLADLKRRCGADTDIFNKDALTMACNAGELRLWLHIKTMLESDVEEIARNAST
jgi:hypothetical protein